MTKPNEEGQSEAISFDAEPMSAKEEFLSIQSMMSMTKQQCL